MAAIDFSAENRRMFVPTVDVAWESPVVVPRALDAAECDAVVALGTALGTEAARVGTTQTESEPDDRTRRSSTAWIACDDASAWIYDRLAAVARRANARFGFDLLGFTEDLQFTVYDGAASHFDWHVDGLAGELATRKLSLVVQLSDSRAYRGGDLELFNQINEWQADDLAEHRRRVRRRGTAVAFPSFEPHRVTPVESGTRRSLVCWIGGPPFR